VCHIRLMVALGSLEYSCNEAVTDFIASADNDFGVDNINDRQMKFFLEMSEKQIEAECVRAGLRQLTMCSIKRPTREGDKKEFSGRLFGQVQRPTCVALSAHKTGLSLKTHIIITLGEKAASRNEIIELRTSGERGNQWKIKVW
jgi:hypothetical protein